tara:strand:+ start:219 stop:518 length:300 start_codon:yes stop_codon:yes gene_type:complete
MGDILQLLGFDQATGFDPHGQGYDYASAKRAGLQKDGTDHWQTRLPLSPEEATRLGLPSDSGLILKGIGHPTYSLSQAADEKLGYRTVFLNGRYYSVKD